MAAITDKEMIAIAKFRSNLSDLKLTGEKDSDLFLIRWLRARELDVAQAETMLRKSLTWRQQHGIDNLLAWNPPQYLHEDFPFEIAGFDKDGSPILIIPYGRWDIRTAVEAGNKNELVTYINFAFESIVDVLRKRSANNVKPITQFVGIYDMAHLSFRQLTSVSAVDVMLDTARRFEAHFPETLKTAYICNSSRIFTLLYGLIKPFLSQRTADKVKIFSNPNKHKAALLHSIAADQLPTHFGGTRGCSIKYYKDGAAKNGILVENSTDEDYVAVTVEAGEKLNIEYSVKYPNTTMSWSFKTDFNDIGFSLWYGTAEELVPYQRLESHLAKQSGSITCIKPGKYIMVFDNTYSVVRSKTLHYTVNITSPEDDDSDETTNL